MLLVLPTVLAIPSPINYSYFIPMPSPIIPVIFFKSLNQVHRPQNCFCPRMSVAHMSVHPEAINN